MLYRNRDLANKEQASVGVIYAEFHNFAGPLMEISAEVLFLEYAHTIISNALIFCLFLSFVRPSIVGNLTIALAVRSRGLQGPITRRNGVESDFKYCRTNNAIFDCREVTMCKKQFHKGKSNLEEVALGILQRRQKKRLSQR